MDATVEAVIFDLGGVVLQWDPRPPYAPVLPEDSIEDFLTRIDFDGWNRGLDRGRTFAESEAELIARFPEDREVILAYQQNFPAALPGPVPGTGAVIAELAKAGRRLVGLTNWSAETFPYAKERFGILRRLEGIVVSGIERVAKPDPAIFELTLSRFGLDPRRTVFVDDSQANVDAAEGVGLTGLAFTGADQLREDLVRLGVLGPPAPVQEPVFHIAVRADWEQADTLGYPFSTRGRRYEQEGFVHCSFTHQLPRVLAESYGDLDWSELTLLELDASRLPIVVEDLGDGPYPHLFAELDPGAVVRRHLAA